MIQPSPYNLAPQRLKIQVRGSKASQWQSQGCKNSSPSSPRKTPFPQRWNQAPGLQTDPAPGPNVRLPELLEYKRPAQEDPYSPAGLTCASLGQRCPPPAAGIHFCALWLPLFPSSPPGTAHPGPWPAPVYTCARREVEGSRCRWPDWQKVAKKRFAYSLLLAGDGDLWARGSLRPAGEAQASVIVLKARGYSETLSGRTIQIRNKRRPDHQMRNQTAICQMRDSRGTGLIPD